MLSGVRPSSGAETLENHAASEMSDTLEPAEVVATEVGRTPVSRSAASGCTGCRAGAQAIREMFGWEYRVEKK